MNAPEAREEEGFGEDDQFEPYRDDPEQNVGEDRAFEADATLDSAGSDGYGKPNWRAAINDRIPPRMVTAWEAVKTWTKGPQPPRIYSITPIFPKIQSAPIALLDRYAPKGVHKLGLLVLFYACWIGAFWMVLWKSSISTNIQGYGTPLRLGCGARYWEDANGCGLNGDECRPFSHAHLAFRCPASCAEQELYTPHTVGDQELLYQPLLVGGPSGNVTGFDKELVANAVYRSDSFICSAAVHAGFINDQQGGCGVLMLTGEQASFEASSSHSISSVGFDSYFPQTFGFVRGTYSQCKDMRWPALIVSVILTTLLSIFTRSPAIFFWSEFVMIFFTVALATDPPNLLDYRRLLSVAIARFLPACFCAWITYRYAVKRSLTDLTAQVEKTILWLGPAWVGALNNYTFDKIPIQRLTPHDLQAQPGAIPALIIILLTILTVALGQAWAFRVEGRMPRYLAIYGIFVATLLFFVTLPGLSLRIHHYILALLFLPGTSFQNRPSLIYQGLLVGLFINGVARWGFASIIELSSDILAGLPQGTLLPEISVLAIGAKNITFNLGMLPMKSSGTVFDGISILVNDVERFRGYGDNEDYWPDDHVTGGNFTWTWKRHRLGNDVDVVAEQEEYDNDSIDTKALLLPEYFRFAYMYGSEVADYTKAGKWEVDGNWTQMRSGPS